MRTREPEPDVVPVPDPGASPQVVELDFRVREQGFGAVSVFLLVQGGRGGLQLGIVPLDLPEDRLHGPLAEAEEAAAQAEEQRRNMISSVQSTFRIMY